jgi:hypothetical protein
MSPLSAVPCAYHQAQQLILQALFCDAEVDQRALCRNLRFVVRVRQLGLHTGNDQPLGWGLQQQAESSCANPRLAHSVQGGQLQAPLYT